MKRPESTLLIYPHQLYREYETLQSAKQVWLIEDPLFFSQFAFHKKKLILHRASMQAFANDLTRKKKIVRYVDACELTDSSQIAQLLRKSKIEKVQAIDPTDNWLRRKVQLGCDQANLPIQWLDDPAFLTSSSVQQEWVGDRKKYYFTDFYMQQRKRLNCLMENAKPLGGKWTFDTENRKKLPKGTLVPNLWIPTKHASVTEAQNYVEGHFPIAIGESAEFVFPVTNSDAEKWLQNFLEVRFESFGNYEDSIEKDQTFLFHSVLTPMLNIGLLTPKQVVDQALTYIEKYPINSVEGFVRQIIGWREFVRLVYLHAGSTQRNRNYWNYTHNIPSSFYTGSTGIEPVDVVIGRVLKHGYCHHIERLMILGNFFLLCEIAPDEVYRWFMEFFVDSYDWVMVPNVYGMSQFADGGLMTTKPYVSGSAYVLKMSNYKKGDWCPIWDALYWRFIAKHREFFKGNPRMSMMTSQLDKMGSKLTEHQRIADDFLEKIHGC